MTDLALAKRNILLLAISQALYSCCVITVFATGSLVGLMLAPNAGLGNNAHHDICSGCCPHHNSGITADAALRPLAGFPLWRSALRGWVPEFPSMRFTPRTLSSFALPRPLQGVFQSTSGFYRFAAVEGASER